MKTISRPVFGLFVGILTISFLVLMPHIAYAENASPILTPIGSKTVNENTLLTFTVEATDPDSGDTLIYSASGLPSGATFTPDSRMFAWTPAYTTATNAEGAKTFNITFTVTDSQGAAAQEIVPITVTSINRPPVAPVLQNKVVDEGGSVSFSAVTDPDGDPMTYTLTGMPLIASISTSGTFSWKPAYCQSGSYVIGITANDGYGGTVTQTVSITVNDVPQTNRLIFDGETTFTPLNGSIDMINAFHGAACFKGASPDAYHTTGINLSGLSSWRKDLSGHEEIWFYAKADAPLSGIKLSITGWPNATGEILMDPYIRPNYDGEVVTGLTTAYHLVRIPIADLVTATYKLQSIEIIYFRTTPLKNIYIDDVWAVNDPGSLAAAPLVGQIGTQDFGEVATKTSSSKTLTVTNIGVGDLVVSGMSIAGTDAKDFSAPADAYTLHSGESRQVTVTFTPTSPGTKTASFVINHNSTLIGSSTIVPLTGLATGAVIEVERSTLDFGTVNTGISSSLKVTISNKGNRSLDLSNIVSGPFNVDPGSFSLAPQESRDITVTFNPQSIGPLQGIVTIGSNDPYHYAETINLKGEGISPGVLMAFPLKVDGVSSSTVKVFYPAVSGAAAVNVRISPEPPLADGMFLVSKAAGTFAPDGKVATIADLAATTDIFIRAEAVTSQGVTVACGYAHAKTVGGPRANLDSSLREVHLVAPNILLLVLENKSVYSDSATTGGVHLYADDNAHGYNGDLWQAGAWTVARNDDSAIDVQAVYRNSIAAGHPVADTKYTNVDHYIYLVLGEAIGSPEVLTVQCQAQQGLGLNCVVPFSDYYLETPAIQINQAGYAPKATERYAYVSWWLGDGGAMLLADFPDSAQVVTELLDPLVLRESLVGAEEIPINPRIPTTKDDEIPGSTYDKMAKTEVREIDLKDVPVSEDAIYRVRIPGVGVSWPTQVSNKAVFRAFYTAMRGMYYNRWGRDLQPEWTDWGPRPPDYHFVYTSEQEHSGYDSGSMFDASNPPPLTGARELTGGHHDAGDFDQQMNHMFWAQFLLEAYEINPTVFTDGQLCVPESGNGIPDILDEALYELKGWEQLQDFGDPADNIQNYEPIETRLNDGGVRQGVESYSYGGPWADTDPLPYWTYSRNAGHSGRVAGVFAQAARIIRPFDTQKSRQLEKRAYAAYQYARNNGIDLTSGGSILYPVSELLQLAGTAGDDIIGDPQQYKDIYEAVFEYLEAQSTNHSGHLISISGDRDRPGWGAWNSTTWGIVPNFLTGYILSPVIDKTTWYYTYPVYRANGTVTSIGQHKIQYAHRNYLDGGSGWGNTTDMGRWIPDIYFFLKIGGLSDTQRQDMINTISIGADLILGCNPMGLAWFTGIGSRHPENPLHIDGQSFLYTTNQGVPPGITVMGPSGGFFAGNNYYNQARKIYYPALPYTSDAGFAAARSQYPLYRRYVDAWTNVITSEGGAGANASYGELFGILLPKPEENGGAAMMPTPDLLPRKALFDTDTYGGQAPLTVNFTDSSHGPIEKWEWDFGDGSTSKEKNPFHTYVRPGSYTVTLTVTCNGGTSDIVKRDLITVTGPRTVALAAPGGSGEKGSVVCDFGGGNGIWVKDGTGGWSLLNNAAARSITSGDIDGDGTSDIIVDFGEGNGIWASLADGSWRRVHEISAQSITTADIDGNGIADLVIDFGPGYGIWSYKNGMEWSLVHLMSATSVTKADTNGDNADELIIDFGPGYGIWLYKDGGGYILLNLVSAREIAGGITIDNDAEGREEVIVDFGSGYGIWCFRNGAVWTLVNPASAKHIAVGDIDTADPRNDIIVDFGPGYGIWIYGNDSAWRLLNTISADSITVGDIAGTNSDDIVIDFGSSNGIWVYKDNMNWEEVWR